MLWRIAHEPRSTRVGRRQTRRTSTKPRFGSIHLGITTRALHQLLRARWVRRAVTKTSRGNLAQQGRIILRLRTAGANHLFRNRRRDAGGRYGGVWVGRRRPQAGVRTLCPIGRRRRAITTLFRHFFAKLTPKHRQNRKRIYPRYARLINRSGREVAILLTETHLLRRLVKTRTGLLREPFPLRARRQTAKYR